uniref:Reverse transcriptase Ty1/copia-type domain-containing protein n=1 Tax=Cannabis sativa TaxID=3483 RepID=A0A803P8Y2_CANSA
MTAAKYDVEKFTGTKDFGLRRMKMKALLVHQGLYEALLRDKSLLDYSMFEKDKKDTLAKSHSVMDCLQGAEVRKEKVTKGLLGKVKLEQFDFYEYCVLGKACRVKFGTDKRNTKGTLDYIHSDYGDPREHYHTLEVASRTELEVEPPIRVETETLIDHSSGDLEDDFRSDNLKSYKLSRDRTQREVKALDGYRHADLIAFLFHVANHIVREKPTNYAQAMKSKGRKKWNKVMLEEMHFLKKNWTWDVISMSEDGKVIGCIDEKKAFQVYKRHDIKQDLKLEQLDVKIVFLYGHLDEIILMKQPEGFEEARKEHWMSKDETEKSEMSRFSYASTVGSLMYVMVCTRPNIAYALSMVSRFMGNPRKEHLEALKWILHYLKGTIEKGLVFGMNN